MRSFKILNVCMVYTSEARKTNFCTESPNEYSRMHSKNLDLVMQKENHVVQIIVNERFQIICRFKRLKEN